MSQKTNNSFSNICERFRRHNCAFYSCSTNKMAYRPIKKVIPSLNLNPNSSKEVKSCSTGVIHSKKLQDDKPRKTTKSDMRFEQNKSVMDFCVKCGDSTKNKKNVSLKSNNCKVLNNLCDDLETQVSIDKERGRNKNVCNKKKMIQQFYKNENFMPSVSSMKDNSKNKIKTLDPITENIEAINDSSETIFKIYSDSVDEIGFLDPEDEKNIEDLKDFREKNYFECHSAKSRVSSKGSVTSLNEHKCVYRFYLNERLFPVPLNTDHRNTIRCVECHLPLEELDSDLEDAINGTLQTKVKLGNDVQDLILILPVKKPLIVPEKRRMKNEKENIVYFGIVKLNENGDSIFSRTLPNNSFALKYQKGYKEFVKNETYEYEKVEEDIVIVI
ncbi:uncharacterized protein [Epargyreus clarus]|uniref:uncharacterized protein n=1 Tax=Epargyreus clarus TaxID=520877 RepID=UPI003C2BFEAD